MQALPDNITTDYQQPISMTYILDQTFDYYGDPTNYKEAISIILYDTEFESNGDWKTSALYKNEFREKSCEDLVQYTAIFKYIMSNLTRQIDDVIEAHLNWPINNKHISYYCGKNPDNNEYFLIDELMIIRGKDWIRDEIFSYNGTKTITTSGKSYETNVFLLNKTLSPDYNS